MFLELLAAMIWLGWMTFALPAAPAPPQEFSLAIKPQVKNCSQITFSVAADYGLTDHDANTMRVDLAHWIYWTQRHCPTNQGDKHG